MTVMDRQTTDSLGALLQQAQAATAAILRQFEERLQVLSAPSPNAADPTAVRWARDLRASQAKLELQEAYRRFTQIVRTLQLQDVISEGEAAPVLGDLERMRREASGAIKERLRQPEHGRGAPRG